MLSILDLPYNGKRIVPYRLPEPLMLEQWVIPTGTEVKLKETENFGWVVLPWDVRDSRGFLIPKHIFRY